MPKDTQEMVILVDENDVQVGSMEKLQAHKANVLHRAVSIIIFDSQGKMLLQRRAFEKYHAGGLWANAACSHPRIGESVLAAAKRRLFEELGITTELKEVFSFIYQTPVTDGLWEHEYDHVFFGTYTGEFKLNSAEVHEVKWLDTTELLQDIKLEPHKYAPWFLLIVKRLQDQHLLN